MRKRLLIFAPIILGLYLRLRDLSHIIFTYDQGRDAFMAQEILHGHLKLVGPPTDFGVLFHGPLHYYVMAAIYFFNKDPRFAVIVFALLNLSALYPLYKLTKKLFHSSLAAWFLLLIFAISPELTFDGRYLSNVALVIPTLAWGLYGLFLGTPSSLIFAAIGFGLAAQAQFFLLSLSLPAFMYLLISRKTIKQILTFIGVYTLTISSFFLAEIKFHFQGVKAILTFLHDSSPSTANLFTRFYDSIFSLSQRNLITFIPIINIFILTLALFLLYRQLRSAFYFLLLFTFSFVILLPFAGPGVLFFTIGSLLPLLLLFVSLLKTFPPLGIILCILLVVSQLPHLAKVPETDYTYTGSETGMILSDELNLIDQIYKFPKDITYTSITVPLYINSTWGYLFYWYGNSRYGFVPPYHGNNQIGRPGEFDVSYSDNKQKFSAVIVDGRVPQHWREQLLKKESYYAKYDQTFTYGNFTLLFGPRRN